MKKITSGLWLLPSLWAMLMPWSARAQVADPAVWGVYARLLGASLVSEKSQGGVPYAWYWDDDHSSLVEDRGATWGRSRIKAMGDGRLARVVDGRQTWTGTVQPDGAVVWQTTGNFLTAVAGGPYRVRLDGAGLVMEHVSLKSGQVAGAWPMQRLTGTIPAAALAPASPPVSASAATLAPAAPATATASATDSATATPPSAPTALAPAPVAAVAAAASAPLAASSGGRPGPRTLSPAELERLRTSLRHGAADPGRGASSGPVPSTRVVDPAPSPATGVAVAQGVSAPASAATTASPLPPSDDGSSGARPALRALSAEDQARLRDSIARDKVRRAEALRREEEEARREAEARRQQAEAEARMAAERAREEREEQRASDDAFAGALMHGLGVFNNEMANHQAQQARQQAFLADLQRQRQEAQDAREREQERRRQAAVQQQQQQQQQAVPARAAGNGMAPSPTTRSGQAQAQSQGEAEAEAAARRQRERDEADRQLRERAAAERQRQQQLRQQRQAGDMVAAAPATPARPTAGASTDDDPHRCVSQPTQVRNPNCKDGSAFTMTNHCEQAVDVKLCIQTQDGRWDCGVSWGVRPGADWSYPSCRGTSSVFMDVRSAGSSSRLADPP